MTKEEARIARTCGVTEAAFEAERKREIEEAAARGQDTTGQDSDGLTAEDRKVIARSAIDRAKFIEERRRERGTAATASAGSRGDAKFLVTADTGEVNRLVAARDAQRQSCTA